MTDDDKAQAELKPCPFCGGDACLSAEKELWLVFCLSSKHEVSTGFFETQAEAVNAWNTRTNDRIEALSAENERLRYELRCIFNDYQGCMADEWIADVRAALGDTE